MPLVTLTKPLIMLRVLTLIHPFPDFEGDLLHQEWACAGRAEAWANSLIYPRQLADLGPTRRTLVKPGVVSTELDTRTFLSLPRAGLQCS